MASSDLIKAWLVDQYRTLGVATPAKGWKRLGKDVDTQGRVVRTFTHPLVGSVAVLETPQGFSFVAHAWQEEPFFTKPSFSPSSLKLARELLNDMADPSLRDSSAFLDGLPKDPRYLEAFPALPSLFSFWFPADTYDNDYENETGRGVDRTVEDLCIYVEAPGQDDYMLTQLIHDRLCALGLSPDDEYHWSFGSDGHLTVREWARRLIALGLVYQPEECLFGKDLTALGATAPGVVDAPPPPKPWQHAFAATLGDDDAAAVKRLVEELSDTPEELANDGRGNTWVDAAFGCKALSIVEVLLANKAPLRCPGQSEAQACLWRWRRLEEASPDQVQRVLRLFAAHPDWDPERDTSWNPRSIVLERDEWARVATGLEANRLNDAWLLGAWEVLSERVGEAGASESFVRAWLHWSDREMSAAFTRRCLRVVEERRELLDAWPSQSTPFPQQALDALVRDHGPSGFSRAIELAQRLKIDLKDVKGADGDTLVQSLQKRVNVAKECWENQIERSRGRLILVFRDANGNDMTQSESCRREWLKEKARLDQLEAFVIPVTPRRRLSFD